MTSSVSHAIPSATMLPVLSAKMIKTIKKAVAATPSKLMSPGQIDSAFHRRTLLARRLLLRTVIEKLVGVRKAKKIVKQLKEEGASVQTASDVIAKIQDNMGKGARQGKLTSKAADKHTKPVRRMLRAARFKAHLASFSDLMCFTRRAPLPPPTTAASRSRAPTPTPTTLKATPAPLTPAARRRRTSPSPSPSARRRPSPAPSERASRTAVSSTLLLCPSVAPSPPRRAALAAHGRGRRPRLVSRVIMYLGKATIINWTRRNMP